MYWFSLSPLFVVTFLANLVCLSFSLTANKLLNLTPRQRSKALVIVTMATKEKMVFTKNYGKFCDFLKHEVTLLPKFVEERIISGDHEEVIRNTAVTQRGQALLAHISGPLDGGQTGGFYIMLEIMKQHGKPDTQEFVNSIELELQGATVEPAAMDDTEPVVKDVPESEPLNSIPSKQAVEDITDTHEEPLYTEDYLKSKHQEDKTDVNFLQYDELTEKQRRVISDTQAIIVVVNSIEFMATMCYLKPRNGLEHVLKTERGTKVGPDSLTHPLWFGDFGKCPVAVIRVKAGHGHHAVSHADKDTFPKVKLIVGVGVAAGFRENGVKLGDVLVSNRIHDCDQYKKKDGKDIPRGNIKNACSLMLQRLQEPFQWMYPCTQDKQRYCEIKPGLILSKPVLIDDKEERKRLLQYFGEEAKGYEMEGFGIMQSSINCIIVKGVCDYAGEKTDDWQPTAALAANDYLHHHFRQDLSVLLEKKQDQSSRTVYVLVAIIVALVGIIIVLLLKGITTATQG